MHLMGVIESLRAPVTANVFAWLCQQLTEAQSRGNPAREAVHLDAGGGVARCRSHLNALGVGLLVTFGCGEVRIRIQGCQDLQRKSSAALHSLFCQ